MDNTLLPIESTGLSVRSSNSLHRAGIHTVGDLLAQDTDSLSSIRNLGAKSIAEILSKINEYKETAATGSIKSDTSDSSKSKVPPFEKWIELEENRNTVVEYLKNQKIKIDVMELLPITTYNKLFFADYTELWQIAFLSTEALTAIPRMTESDAKEVNRHLMYYLKMIKNNFNITTPKSNEQPLTIHDAIADPDYHKIILKYVKTNNYTFAEMGINNRGINQLHSNGHSMLSDIIFLTREDLAKIPHLGATTINIICNKINEYLAKNSKRILSFINGDEEALFDDESIYRTILSLYDRMEFKGLSLNEITEKLNLPKAISEERLKRIIGKLLAENKLVYVDFRCHRVYDKFIDYLNNCKDISEEDRDILSRKLNGETLEFIGTSYNLTRERIRQRVNKNNHTLHKHHLTATGTSLFDEDYYAYLYRNYSFNKKDAEKWFSIPNYVWSYLEINGIKQGTKKLDLALDDVKNLDAGLRLKIKNYLNRNKLFIDGVWVEKKRILLEEIVMRKFCSDNVSFKDFTVLYNDYLKELEVPEGDDIYYTEDLERARKNRISDSRYALWKLNEKIRYYDIDGRDYTELLSVLNLDAYENIELSTEKFMRMYPDVMKKYDIRDRYELHNLLRKIIPDGSYHDFHCSRTPDIRFGTFDREKAFLEILMENAPLSTPDLVELICNEYGYEPGVTASTYLQPLSRFYHQGIYTIDQKRMSIENSAKLRSALINDFYFIDEIKDIYSKIAPDASLEEINPYNLKAIGFQTLSRYALKNHLTLEEYFELILAEDDTFNISKFRNRYTAIQTFYTKLAQMKKSLQIIEYSQDEYINLRKLERAGVTKENLYDFCDAVYDFAKDKDFFTIHSLTLEGFDHELFELGFSDLFYSSILLSDDRLCPYTMLNNTFFFTESKNITIKEFLVEIVESFGVIDVYDLMNLLVENYGCKINEKYTLIEKTAGTKIYHDKILDRLYATEDLYYQELDKI